jgi:hypothetical protein
VLGERHMNKNTIKDPSLFLDGETNEYILNGICAQFTVSRSVKYPLFHHSLFFHNFANLFSNG